MSTSPEISSWQSRLQAVGPSGEPFSGAMAGLRMLDTSRGSIRQAALVVAVHLGQEPVDEQQRIDLVPHRHLRRILAVGGEGDAGLLEDSRRGSAALCHSPSAARSSSSAGSARPSARKASDRRRGGGRRAAAPAARRPTRRCGPSRRTSARAARARVRRTPPALGRGEVAVAHAGAGQALLVGRILFQVTPASCMTPSECSKRECVAPGKTNDRNASWRMRRRRWTTG